MPPVLPISHIGVRSGVVRPSAVAVCNEVGGWRPLNSSTKMHGDCLAGLSNFTGCEPVAISSRVGSESSFGKQSGSVDSQCESRSQPASGAVRIPEPTRMKIGLLPESPD